MTHRPEAHGDEYRRVEEQKHDDFEPWRPGDAPVTDEYSARWQPSHPQSAGRGGPGQPEQPPAAELEARQQADKQVRGGFRWTEDVVRPYRQGDRVSNATAAGGSLVRHVPAGTRGQVVSTRSGLLGGEYATVAFENGYTEEVRVDDLQRERGWF